MNTKYTVPVKPKIEAERLVKILGLLGSAHPGERAAAALKADSLVRSAGLTWRDVIMPSPPTVPQTDDGRDWRRIAAECAVYAARLRPAERQFVADMARLSRQPSPKQFAWLADIHARVVQGEACR